MMRSALLKRWLPAGRPAATRQQRRPRANSILLILVVMVVAFLLGAVAGLGSPVLLTLLAGPILVLLLFFTVNAHGMLVSLFIVTFLVQGSLLYFAHLRQATWVAVGMAALFFVRVVMDQTMRRRVKEKLPSVGAIMFWIGALAACYCLSLVLNRPPVGQMIASFKAFWPMFGVVLAFYWVRWNPEHLRQLWYMTIVVMVLQVPVVLYQHFFIASTKFGAFDSVVGTFGGTQLAGGLSAVMVYFVIITLTFVLGLWSRGLMSSRATLLLSAAAVLVILMGEVKASFIWLPVAVFFILRKRMLRNIKSLITYSCVAACLCGAIYTTYNQLYWSGQMDRLGTVSEKLEAGGGYFFDPENLNYVTGEVSRGASIALWVTDRVSSPLARAFGNGPNSSKSGGLMGAGKIAKRFAPLYIDATALAVLLWDIGVAGAVAYFGIIISTMRAGWRFVKAGQGSGVQLAAVETCTAAMGLGLTLMFYNRSLVDEPTMQLLFLFCVAYVVQCVRFGPDRTGPAETAPIPASRSRRTLVLRPAN